MDIFDAGKSLAKSGTLVVGFIVSLSQLVFANNVQVIRCRYVFQEVFRRFRGFFLVFWGFQPVLYVFLQLVFCYALHLFAP